MRFGLLKNGGQEISGVHFLPLSALDVQHRRLEHAAECRGLFRVVFLTLLELLNRLVEIGVELVPEALEVGAAGGENTLAVRIVRQRVQQMLER